MYLTDMLQVLRLLRIVTEVCNIDLRILIGRHRSVFLRRFKAEGVLELIHHMIDVSIVSPRKNLVILLILLDALKVDTKEIFCRRCLLNGESISSY